MLNVSFDLAMVALMLFSIFAPGNPIEVDILNDPTLQPILGAEREMGIVRSRFKSPRRKNSGQYN